MRRLLALLLVLAVLSGCAGGGGSAQPTGALTGTPAGGLQGSQAAGETPAPGITEGPPPAETTAPVPENTAAPTAAPTADLARQTPPAGEFVNPVIRTNFPDPFVLFDGGTFYAYATNGGSGNVQMATSKDLVSWTIGTDAMPALAKWVRLSGPDVWAPEVAKVGEKYLLYYTARDKASGKQCVGVAVADLPKGKFRDASEKPLVCQLNEGGTIDASPFKDANTLYLLYKNDGNCCGYPTYIYIQELAPDGLSLVGEPVRLARNDQPWEGRVIEAPTMYVHEGKYYLFFSANDYGGPSYSVGYAACDGPTGPCQDAPENPILKSQMQTVPRVNGPGHQALVTVNGQTWIVYHAWQMNPNGTRTDNRQVYIDQVDWIDGRPVVEGPDTVPQEKPIP